MATRKAASDCRPSLIAAIRAFSRSKAALVQVDEKLAFTAAIGAVYLTVRE